MRMGRRPRKPQPRRPRMMRRRRMRKLPRASLNSGTVTPKQILSRMRWLNLLNQTFSGLLLCKLTLSSPSLSPRMTKRP